jgi:transposase
MREPDIQQTTMYSYLSPEQRVPADHPLRLIREMTNRILLRLSTLFSEIFSPLGRGSIPPERRLRALLLQVLYSIRRERMRREQLNYNLLFRWFVGWNMDAAVWDVTVYTKNRERLLNAEVAQRLFDLVVGEAHSQNLMSDEHFTVDGTRLEVCAGWKSFKKKEGEEEAPGDDPGNPTVDFQGEKRSHERHASTTDPEAKLAKKGRGKEAQLSYSGQVWMENRNGMSVDLEVLAATGTAEKEAALNLLEVIPGEERVTVGADKT